MNRFEAQAAHFKALRTLLHSTLPRLDRRMQEANPGVPLGFWSKISYFSIKLHRPDILALPALKAEALALRSELGSEYTRLHGVLQEIADEIKECFEPIDERYIFLLHEIFTITKSSGPLMGVEFEPHYSRTRGYVEIPHKFSPARAQKELKPFLSELQAKSKHSILQPRLLELIDELTVHLLLQTARGGKP